MEHCSRCSAARRKYAMMLSIMYCLRSGSGIRGTRAGLGVVGRCNDDGRVTLGLDQISSLTFGAEVGVINETVVLMFGLKVLFDFTGFGVMVFAFLVGLGFGITGRLVLKRFVLMKYSPTSITENVTNADCPWQNELSACVIPHRLPDERPISSLLCKCLGKFRSISSIKHWCSKWSEL